MTSISLKLNNDRTKILLVSPKYFSSLTSDDQVTPSHAVCNLGVMFDSLFKPIYQAL